MNENSWVFGLSAFTIRDGDAADFETGQDVDFAVLLVPMPAWTAAAEPDSVVFSAGLSGDVRDFLGEVVEFRDGAWILDVGILVCGDGDWPVVFAGREEPGVSVGDRFVGRGSFEVVALGEYDVAAFRGLVPPRYTWRINRIELDTTPWIEDEPTSFIRDPQNAAYRWVDRTDSLGDDNGQADYLLHCSLVLAPLARAQEA